MSSAKKLSVDGFISVENLEISSTDYVFFANKLYELSGIHLPENEKNRALVKNRLARLLRKYNLSGYDQLVQKVQTWSKQELDEFISSLTTNKTEFYREKLHFEHFEKQIRNHFQNHHELRIWCAAASTGQEPYTIAMACAENLSPADLKKTRILATDIDLEALNKGAEGFYSKLELTGISPQLEKKHFEEFAGQFRIADSLKSLITFCPFNLVKGPYQFKQPFHYIFCRNVLIYFDVETCHFVITKLVQNLNSEGTLFLGQSETGLMQSPDVTALGSAIYKRKRL